MKELQNVMVQDDAVMEELNTSITHGICVSNMVYFLSQKLGYEEDFCHEMAVAGMLHDIGKIRAFRLLYVEEGGQHFIVKQMKYLRQHPFLGYEALKDQGYSDLVLESILYHHENYDGSGFPDNLSGKEIPVGARILRICDVFVALVSRKAYRPPHSKDAALQFMIGDVKYFDMEIFLAFMNLVDEIDVDRDIKKHMDV